MSFRVRLLLAFVVLALAPLVAFAIGVRREMGGRLTGAYERRVESRVAAIQGNLGRESEAIARRLRALRRAIADDNRFRLAVVQGATSERPYLLDYAGNAMRLAGLSMLQIQDDSGRILSSGHFRNEFDRLEPGLPEGIAAVPGGAALVEARTPDGPILALVRVDSLRLAGRRLHIVGGVSVEDRFLERLSGDDELRVRLVYPGGVLTVGGTVDGRDDGGPAGGARSRTGRDLLAGGGAKGRAGRAVVRELAMPFVATRTGGRAQAPVVPGAGGARAGGAAAAARLVVTSPLAPLDVLRRSVDLWFLAAVGITGLAALLLAGWVSARISRPLTELARKTARVDLERLDVAFYTTRRDEIGALSRLLAAMTERLRAGASRLRDAERRATLGEIARQVNHDIKNGLAPIRNVIRHLTEVARRDPSRVATVLEERRGSLDSSISYLESLSANYARLSPALELRPCDVNAVVRKVVAGARGRRRAPGRSGFASEPPPVDADSAASERGGDVRLRRLLADGLPAVRADPVALRRILENLVGNAIESLEGSGGTVTVSTELVTEGGAGAGPTEHRRVRIAIADTGPGLTAEELERIFQDFYTTKPGGTGLGLSVVRRLVADLGGSLRAESEPGAGSRFVVELEAAEAVEAAGTRPGVPRERTPVRRRNEPQRGAGTNPGAPPERRGNRPGRAPGTNPAHGEPVESDS